MDLGNIFRSLKKSRFAPVVYIPLTAVLDVGIAFAGSCLGAILMGLVTFGVPYLFGVRDLKVFLKVGTLIIILTGLILGTLFTVFMYERLYIFGLESVDGTQMKDGTITPYQGDDSTRFNFTVTYTGTDSPDNITIYANITTLDGVPEKSLPLESSGSLFYNETTLPRNAYFYYFAINDSTNGTWHETEFGPGPVAGQFNYMIWVQISRDLITIFLSGGLFFYLVLVMYNWRRRTEEERVKLEDGVVVKGKGRGDGDEKDDEGFACTECGADVPADASRCPSCNEPFEDEKPKDEDEFECTECGADVPSDAIRCPSCGEPFDGEEEEKKEVTAKKIAIYSCNMCGANVPGDAKECPSCGEAFDD